MSVRVRSRPSHLVWGVLLVAALLVSGCASKSKTTTSVIAQVSDDTGGIDGVVMDEEEIPLAGARVGIIGLQHDIAQTDEAGGFSLGLVPPGRYSLQFTALGFEDAIEWVEVAAGQVTSIDVKLVKIAIAEPYHSTLASSGIFGCGSSWRPGIPAVGISGLAACGLLAAADGTGVDTTPYDKFLIAWNVTGPIAAWNASVLEMEWTSTQVFGKGLWMIWEVDGCVNADGHAGRFSSMEGRSPLRDVTDLGQMDSSKGEGCVDDCDGETCTVISRVFATAETFGPSSAADIGLSLQQPFTQHLTAFFHTPAPADFTVLG